MYKQTAANLQEGQSLSKKQMAIIAIHAFIAWALCAATMGIGMVVTSIQTALIVHAIGAPIFSAGISFNYFKKYNYTSPLKTAIIFVSFVILVDFFLVAMVINKSFDMFTDPLGTWIPFALIFASTYLTGMVLTKGATS